MHALPLCLITLTTLLPAAGPENPTNAPVSVEVLVVTGVDYAGHLWKDTGPAMRNVLEKDKTDRGAGPGRPQSFSPRLPLPTMT